MVKPALDKPAVQSQITVASMSSTASHFELLAPSLWKIPAVFNSPHSGRNFPTNFLVHTRLSEIELRQSEDVLVDELFLGCLDAGAPMLRALSSRAWLDLNREPYELDPRLFLEPLHGYMNPGTPRVAAGFGTVPRLVGDGIEIYRGRIPLAEAMMRIETCHKPYHRLLGELVRKCHEATGFVLLVDCHSMPSGGGGTALHQPDVVLGDRFGSACAPLLSQLAAEYFQRAGLHVALNKPYAGGFITEAYAAPRQDRHALQIELNRGLYLDERRLEPTKDFARLKSVLDGFAAKSGEWIGQAQAEANRKLAAE